MLSQNLGVQHVLHFQAELSKPEISANRRRCPHALHSNISLATALPESSLQTSSLRRHHKVLRVLTWRACRACRRLRESSARRSPRGPSSPRWEKERREKEGKGREEAKAALGGSGSSCWLTSPHCKLRSCRTCRNATERAGKQK